MFEQFALETEGNSRTRGEGPDLYIEHPRTAARMKSEWEEIMFRIATLIFALGIATSARAAPSVPIQQPDTIVIQIRQGCGAGMRVSGRCVATPARRQVRRGVVRNW
jgi:hypothetical protein